MSISGRPGPLVVFGQNPSQGGTAYTSDYNGDQSPSAFVQGQLLLDPRYGYRAALQAGTLSAIGFFQGADIMLVDETPATAAVAAIAAAANPASGTAMTLVSASGAGITVSSTSNVSNTVNGSAVTNTTGIVTMQPSGTILPVGTLFINSTPSWILFGQNGSVGCMDPRNSIARAVSVTGVASGSGGAVTVRGWDLFGYPMSETITLAAGANTVNGKRAFKAIKSATPAFTDTHAISIGTADIFGFPLMITNFAQAYIVWNMGVITANTGFLAGVTTTMTATNGDVRGTYAVQSASDGTKTLQLFLSPAPWNIGQVNGTASLCGQLQFSN